MQTCAILCPFYNVVAVIAFEFLISNLHLQHTHCVHVQVLYPSLKSSMQIIIIYAFYFYLLSADIDCDAYVFDYFTQEENI